MRAARWHQKHDDPVAAVEYALASGDLDLAAGLMEQVVGFLFIRSELTTMKEWAERLPQAVLAGHPALCVALGWAANATGRLDLCENLIQLTESAAVEPVLKMWEDEPSMPYEYRAGSERFSQADQSFPIRRQEVAAPE